MMFGVDGGNFDTAGVEVQVIWQALSRFVGKSSSSVGRLARAGSSGCSGVSGAE